MPRPRARARGGRPHGAPTQCGSAIPRVAARGSLLVSGMILSGRQPPMKAGRIGAQRFAAPIQPLTRAPTASSTWTAVPVLGTDGGSSTTGMVVFVMMAVYSFEMTAT